MSQYNKEFYKEMKERNSKVADIIMPYIIEKLSPKSIVDVGCGQGIFLEYAEKIGIDVCGIDGEWVEKDKLMISNFVSADLSSPLNLNRKYDLAISFEVAEHIPRENADVFIDNITRLSDVVAFSGAIPGQGGVGHVNEEYSDYWINKFEKRGYKPSNVLRKRFWKESGISPWRRQNIILFVRGEFYDEIVDKFEEFQEIASMVHPEAYERELNEVRYNSVMIRNFNYMQSVIDKKIVDLAYKKLAYKYYHKNFWDLVDEVYILKNLCEESKTFKEFFSCQHLDNFCRKRNTKKFIVWGAGIDGKRVVELICLLGFEVDYWIDKNNATENIVSSDRFKELYSGQNIIIASRKYWLEIVEDAIGYIPGIESSIFQYAFEKTIILQNKEFMKKSVLSYPPQWITVGVTSACDHKCLFCSYHGEDGREISKVHGLGYMLDFEQFKRIVDMAYIGGVPRVHICGTGEPFYNPNILDMIDYAIEKYGELSLQTDFHKALYEKRGYLDELIKREKYIEYIATDILSGLPSEHEQIKVGSNYNSLMESLEYICNNSSILIKVVVVLTRQNYKNLLLMLDDLDNRNINYELLIVNLLSYDYSDFTSSQNVYSREDEEITRVLNAIKKRMDNKGIKAVIPNPKEDEEQCYVFWTEFQTWPTKGCEKERYIENMIPHACAAVVRGELSSLGYLFDYENIMDAWNNPVLVEIRENMIRGKYPDEWCKTCMFNKHK